MPCRQGLSSHVFAYIKSIEPRRYEIVDVEHGVVFADSVFNHPGTVLTVDSPELVQVSAVIVKVPYRMPPGW
jgi:hypothetical protein